MNIANHKNIYKIAVFLAVITVVFIPLFNRIPTTIHAATSAKMQFDQSNVMDDLQSATINGAPFNIADFPYDSEGIVNHPRILTVIEYCYSIRPVQRNNYGVYIYFYNPQALNISTESVVNKILLGIAYSTDKDGNIKVDGYEKFALQFCSKSTGDYRDLFYKFKIIDHKSSDGKTISERVNSNARRYDIGEIELLNVGDKKATAYGVGCTYTYTGYAAGYGVDQNAESTLDCTAKKLDTVELDVTHYTYRSDIDNPNMTHHNQVDSVYFSVPKDIRNEYDELQRVRAEWWEYRTTPIIVTNDYTLADYLLSYAGVDIGVYDSNKTYSLGAGKVVSSPGVSHITSYDWSYNIEQYAQKPIGIYYFTQNSRKISTMLAWIFKTNNPGESVTDNYRLPAERLFEYIDNYNTDKYIDYAKRYPSDLFTTDVGAGRTAGYNNKNFDAGEGFDFTEYSPSSSTYSFWQSLKSAFGWKPEQEDILTGISPIHELEANDFSGDVAKKLLIHDGEDFNNLKTFYDRETAKGNAVFVFHYACTEYYADMLEVTGNKAVENDTTFVAEENVFLDFDILELTFTKDDMFYVIPVVMSPVDLIADIVGPVVPDNTPYWLIVVMLLGVAVAAIIATAIAYKMVFFALDAITDLFTPSYSHRRRRR